jgi:general secretion pathway protein L
MSEFLVVRYFGVDHPLEWVRSLDRGRGISPPQKGQVMPVMPDINRVIVIVPSEHVLLAKTQIPSRAHEQMRRAIPYALEEQLIDPVESMHFAFVPHPAESCQTVFAVRREQLKQWLADLEQRGVQPDCMLPDSWFLPASEHQLGLLLEGDRALVRVSRAQAWGTTISDLNDWLQLYLAQIGEAKLAVHVWGKEKWGTAPGYVEESYEPPKDFLLTIADALAKNPHCPNLLMGSFTVQHRSVSIRRKLKIALGMMIVSLTLAFMNAFIEYKMQKKQHDQVIGRMEAIYRGIYPEGRLGINYADRMRADYQTLGSGKLGPNPLVMLDQIAPLLTQSAQIVIKSIEYRAGVLEVLVLAPSVEMIDGLREGAAKIPQKHAELVSAVSIEQGAEGRIRFSEGAP